MSQSPRCLPQGQAAEAEAEARPQVWEPQQGQASAQEAVPQQAQAAASRAQVQEQARGPLLQGATQAQHAH